jgi:hypothetical protein
VKSTLGTALHDPQNDGPAEQEGQSRSNERFAFVRNVGPDSLNHDALLTLLKYARLL